MFKAVIHASELLTGAGIRAKDGRRIVEEDLGRIIDGAIVYEVEKKKGTEIPTKIRWVGPTSQLPKQFARIKKTDLRGQKAVIPGLIDCHTHLVFAGDRSEEFALRCGGTSYEEISRRGGGILSTIRPTRDASVAQLERLAIPRLREAMKFGIRTIEIKSGYGLDLESELKSLEVIQRLKARFPTITIRATFLGAHAIPPETDRAAYVETVCNQMLPMVKKRKLAEACDIFVDRGYFSTEDARKILGKAKKLGFSIKLHGDELVNTESASLAVELNALSVDHLLHVSDRGIQDLGRSDTVAVLLPGTAFYLKADHAPARKLIEAGACVAVSTDFNPGSSMCNSLPSILTIAALYLGMTRAEIFSAVTYNAAKALALHRRKGTLERGKDADFSILPFKKFEEIYYRFAWTP